MSEDAPTSRKDRKAQRDAERHKGGKKRKRGDDTEEQTAQSELQRDFVPLTDDAGRDAVVEGRVSKKARKEGRKGDGAALGSDSKRKREEKSDNRAEEDGVQPPEAPETKAEKKQRKSKARKLKRDAQEGEDAAPTANTEGEEVKDAETGGEVTKTTPQNKTRFILFIGNLPWDTTDASLQNYFKSIAPFKLRHRTDPATHKSKGFAFLEFENYDRMQTCIKLYHNSEFDPEFHNGASGGGKEGRKKQGKPRKIRVELTAGGGGSKEGRMEKIKAKNVKLDEQRKRKAEAERKEREKEEKEEKEGGKGKDGGGKGKNKKSQNGGVASQEKVEQEPLVMQSDDAAQVHPSRLARVMG